jgi:calcium-dependent protein kinase
VPCVGSPPFYGKNEKEIFTGVLKGKLDFSAPPWPQISDAAKDLVTSMLDLNPAARPTTDQMLKHPWLQEHGVAPGMSNVNCTASPAQSYMLLTLCLLAADKLLDSVVIRRMKDFAGMNKLRKVKTKAWCGIHTANT